MTAQLQQLLARNGIDAIVPPQGQSTTARCPKCSDEREKTYDECLFIVHKDEGGLFWQCYNGGCDYKSPTPAETAEAFTVRGENPMVGGDPVDVAEPAEVDPTRKFIERVPFAPNFRNLPYDILHWLETERRILPSTVETFGVGASEWKFKPDSYAQTALCFPYYEYNEIDMWAVVNYKFRCLTRKTFAMCPGIRRKFLYNAHRVRDRWNKGARRMVMFVEGELDVLSLHQSGCEFSVSIPNGATKGRNSSVMQAIASYPFLEWAEVILLGGDTDAVGENVMREIAANPIFEHKEIRVCNWARYTMPDGKPCKDANDVLVARGAGIVQECIKRAHKYQPPISKDAQ